MKDRFKRRILISTLTMLCICSQLGNTTVMAMSNKDITDLINDVGHEVSIVIEEDKVEDTPLVIDLSKIKKTTGKKSTFSSDGRYYYGAYTGKAYETTKYLSEQHPELKKELDDYFGRDILLRDGNFTTFHTGYSSYVRKALTSKTMSLELGDIAVKNGLVNRNNTKASALLALATYYGVINTKDGLLDYSNSTKAYLTRGQAALMIGRYNHPKSYCMDPVTPEHGIKNSYAYEVLGNDGDITHYINHYRQYMLLGAGDSGYTKKEIESGMTRLEFIWTIMDRYFRPDMMRTAVEMSETGRSSADYFKDIKREDITMDMDFHRKNKLVYKINGYEVDVDGADNKAFRMCLENKELLSSYDVAILTAYDLGIITPNEKGNANLFSKVTMSQGLRFLVASSELYYNK